MTLAKSLVNEGDIVLSSGITVSSNSVVNSVVNDDAYLGWDSDSSERALGHYSYSGSLNSDTCEQIGAPWTFETVSVETDEYILFQSTRAVIKVFKEGPVNAQFPYHQVQYFDDDVDMLAFEGDNIFVGLASGKIVAFLDDFQFSNQEGYEYSIVDHGADEGDQISAIEVSNNAGELSLNVGISNPVLEINDEIQLSVVNGSELIIQEDRGLWLSNESSMDVIVNDSDQIELQCP